MTESLFKVVEHGGIDPSQESAKMVAKHLSAYEFTSAYAQGKKALEIGHGDGYGSSRMAKIAAHVTAIDLFEQNVETANKRYSDANLSFLAMNATELEFADETFDLVFSFQVIEHIPRQQLGKYASEIKRVLKTGGVGCISTLNLKKNMKPGQDYDKSPHHDKEFTPDEYIEFFKGHFEDVEMYGLYPSSKLAFFERLKKSGIFKMLPTVVNPVDKYYSAISVSDFAWISKSNLDDCIDLMAVIRK
ncbi:MAG: class I SAM-dependent methyltransferase [Candidatus Omnitrophica bacterium]|nr:class I SAM-dependent methyltransferase [Candidatus Omnitrophota bacterium]